MKSQELKNLRDVFAEVGLERTPEEVRNLPVDELDNFRFVRERFKSVKPIIEHLKGKLDAGLIDMDGFAAELTELVDNGIEFTPDVCYHYLLMNKVFIYED